MSILIRGSPMAMLFPGSNSSILLLLIHLIKSANSYGKYPEP
ncbi:hypothetical protein CLV59_10865 [Chitinophaga dinghuensis]|uniref:Uncharacterized protein n=1 Tax=Chitinophaga dinghuensis TaxID=1539050 RepID=A0A327VQ36_9BACT|nr:hypothetical protein CLV59_10865 [Chitinophaga dinghuensis]